MFFYLKNQQWLDCILFLENKSKNNWFQSIVNTNEVDHKLNWNLVFFPTLFTINVMFFSHLKNLEFFKKWL